MHLNGLNGTGRAKDSKILVLAAFFAYFLPLLAKSMSPKAIPKKKQEENKILVTNSLFGFERLIKNKLKKKIYFR